MRRWRWIYYKLRDTDKRMSLSLWPRTSDPTVNLPTPYHWFVTCDIDKPLTFSQDHQTITKTNFHVLRDTSEIVIIPLQKSFINEIDEVENVKHLT